MTMHSDVRLAIRDVWLRFAAGQISQEKADRLDRELRTRVGLQCDAPVVQLPEISTNRKVDQTPARKRRPIERAEDSHGRKSYAKEKLAWLSQVARDPAARNGLPLAVVLALDHLNNSDAQCDPGDARLAAELNTTQRTIIRWRNDLKEAGYLGSEKRGAGMPRHLTANHVLLIDPEEL